MKRRQKKLGRQEIFPEEILAHLPNQIRNYLDNEYTALFLFRDVVERQSGVNGIVPWGVSIQPTEPYDLDKRVQAIIEAGRLDILEKIDRLKDFFSLVFLSRIFKSKNDVQHILRLFTVVRTFFAERKTVSVSEAKESLDSLMWYIERIRMALLIEDEHPVFA